VQDDLHTTCMQPGSNPSQTLRLQCLHMFSGFSNRLAFVPSLVLGEGMQDSFLQGPLTRDLSGRSVEAVEAYYYYTQLHP
jgi:hypothetical protein